MSKTTLKKHYHRKRHNVSLLHAHLVFCVKYRKRVLTPTVFIRIKRSIERSAKALGITLEALEGDGDHLHALFCYPPNLSLSIIVQRLKGASSRFIRQQKLPEVMRRLWAKHFWAPSYFVVSCGGAPLDIVQAYVDTQQTRPTKRATSTHHRLQGSSQRSAKSGKCSSGAIESRTGGARPAKLALIEAQSASISSIYTTTHQKTRLTSPH